MNWVIRLGLGTSAGASMAWDEFLRSAELDAEKAKDFAKRAGEIMIEYAEKRARRTDPKWETGLPIRAAFSARIKGNGKCGEIDWWSVREQAPTEIQLSDAGVAIAIGEKACKRAAQLLASMIAVETVPPDHIPSAHHLN